MEYIEYTYRKMFKLSNKEMMDEPIDKFLLNLQFKQIENKVRQAEMERSQNRQLKSTSGN